jgi:hypothetical protein
MARPPRQIFQKLGKSITDLPKNIKENTIKYFLVFFIFTELLSFVIEIFDPKLYYEVVFYVFIQLQFLVLFLFLLRFNFCKRNKYIIYFLLFYFASNILLPFYLNNENYTLIIRICTMILLTLLLSFTLFGKNKNE